MQRSEATANQHLVAAAVRGQRWAPSYFEYVADVEESRAARREVRRIIRSPLSSITGVDPYNSRLGALLRVLS
jgi:hypothetical protein